MLGIIEERRDVTKALVADAVKLKTADRMHAVTGASNKHRVKSSVGYRRNATTVRTHRISTDADDATCRFGFRSEGADFMATPKTTVWSRTQRVIAM